MAILTRYLLRAHIGPFFFSLSLLTGLLLVNTVARRFEELAGKGLGARVIGEVFLLSIPHILALTLPMAVLVAVLHAFSQLTAENEISALKANGVSLVRLTMPLIGVAMALAGAMVLFNDRILPETNHALKNLLVDIGRKSPTLELEEQTINEIRTGDLRTRYFLQAARIEPATNRLQDVVIYDLSAPGRGRTVYADSGRMAFNQERTDLFLTLYDGWINETADTDPGGFQRLYFDRQLVRLAGVGNELQRTTEMTYRSDREMSLGMLWDEIAARRGELAELRQRAAVESRRAAEAALKPDRWHDARAGDRVGRLLESGEPAPLRRGPPVAGALAQPAAFAAPQRLEPPAFVAQAPAEGRAVDQIVRGRAGRGAGVMNDELTRRTTSELRSLNGRADVLQSRIWSYEVEYHKKYAIPFACIVFVLIGAPLAVRFPRGGVGMVIAASLSIFMIYYVGLIGGENLADDGHVNPMLAMWATNIVFFSLGVWAMSRLGKEISTTRGGGFEDLWITVRDAVARPFRRHAAA